jgi:hypothetical protein
MSIRCALLPCGPTYSARWIGVWRFADYLPRARRCLVAVPRRVSVRGKSTFSSCARWGSLCLLTLQWCSPCDGPQPPPHHPGVHFAMVVVSTPRFPPKMPTPSQQLEITTDALWLLAPARNTNTPHVGAGSLGGEWEFWRTEGSRTAPCHAHGPTIVTTRQSDDRDRS